mgnify:CR=1 FL=1
MKTDMYCRKCGAENQDYAQFCKDCGASLRKVEMPNVKKKQKKYDKETGTYQEVSEEPNHILSISQSGEQVSVLIKDKNTGYGMDAHLLLESQYDSVESYKEYRKKYVARTLLTEQEATQREEQELFW